MQGGCKEQKQREGEREEERAGLYVSMMAMSSAPCSLLMAVQLFLLQITALR